MSTPDWFDEQDDAETPPPAPVRRRRSRLVPTLVILAFLGLALTILSEVLSDVWWYDSVGYRGVFVTELTTKVGLFVAGAVVMAVAVGASLWAAYRNRPIRLPVTDADHVLEQYRLALEPLRRIAVVGVPTILGLLGGAGAMGAWRSWLLWRNAQPFGAVDAQFGRDLGYYVFTLPLQRFVVGYLTAVVLLAFIAGILAHYVYGGLQLPGRGPSTRAAFVQLGATGAALLLLRGAGYWLDRAGLLTDVSQLGSRSAAFTGMTWTAEHAVLPTKTILAVAAILCALLFLAPIWTRTWRLPLIGVGLLALVSVLVGTIYPALVQSIKVKPSEQSLEAPYISRNIEATRSAFGLEAIATTAYSGRPTVTSSSTAASEAASITGVRLNDPGIVGATMRQKQGTLTYYTFPDNLDVDRYTVDGVVHDAVVAVREIDLGGVATRNWINDHTVYTHGFGFYAAYGDKVTAEGDPVLFSQGEPGGSSALGPVEQRIYFGEQSPEYSVVGAPEGTAPREVDYPDAKSTHETNNTYQGGGGVPVGSTWRRLAYAVKYREPNLLLSDAVNSRSRLLDHRDPKERVQRVAPWLTLDDNVYPAVVDGRIQWIVEGFTTTSDYPNSQLTDIAAATSETLDRTTPTIGGVNRVNYVRNSVKATVDAYDGTVRLYAWEPDDPLLRAWSAAFPGTVRPMSEISASLMSHLRYPADLLKIQRQLVISYHVTDPGAFYTAQDFWRIPSDPAHPDVRDQPVYYQSVAMPGGSGSRFSVTSTFVPSTASTVSATGETQNKETLRAFLAVDADSGTKAGVRSPGYGTMRLLVLPGDSTTLGPSLVENRFETSTERSQNKVENLNLQQFIRTAKQGSFTYGNLLTLPFGGGFLNVQPLFIQTGKGPGSFPQMKAVVAMYGDRVAWGTTLSQAIGGLFGEAPSGPTPGTGTGTGTPAQQLAAALEQAQQAYADGQAALKRGDFAGYGEAQKRLEAALSRAQALAPAVTGQPGVASPTPTPTPTP